MAINNAVNLQTADFTVTGNWQHDGGFGVNAPTAVTVQSAADINVHSTNGNVTIQSSGTFTANLVGDQVNVNSNNGVTIGGGAGQVLLDTTNSNVVINTNTGNFSVFAGTGPTPGQIILGSTDDISISSVTGNIGMTSAGNASWTVGTAGLFGGVSIGAGMSFDAVAGNVSFGTGSPAGTFQAGSLNAMATLAGGGGLTLVSSAGNVTVTGLQIILDSASVQLPNIPSATTANVLFYDSTTKEVSFQSAASGINAWFTDGSNSGTLVFGTNSTDGWSYQADSVTFATVSSAGDTTWTGAAQFNGSFGINNTTAITITTTNNMQILATAGNLALQANTLNADATGDVEYSSNAGHILFSTNNGDLTFDCNGSGKNISAYASDGTAFLGSFAGTTISSATNDLTLLGGDTVTLTGANAVVFSSTATTVTLNAGTDIVLNPTGNLQASIGSQASTPGVPAIIPPVGFSYVIREDATGNIYYLT